MSDIEDKAYKVVSSFAAVLVNAFFILAANAVYKKQDYQALISLAQDKATYIETLIKEGLPDADTFHRYLEQQKHVTLAALRGALWKKTAKLLKKIKGRYILIFDETYEPYFGKHKTQWVHEYKPVNGCNGCFKFLCAHVLAPDGTRIFIDAVPMPFFSDRTKVLNDMLGFALRNNKNVFCVLFDRGFYDSKIIALLNRLCLNYLMLVPQIGNMKQVLDGNKKDFFTLKYLVNGISETNIFVFRDEKFVWIFATNLKFRNALNMIKLYKKRWNVETGFRVCDEARIKTKSMHMEVRYFFFLCSIVLYDIWKERYPNMAFKRMIQIAACERCKEMQFEKGFLCGCEYSGMHVLH
jgi:hypothetical protein